MKTAGSSKVRTTTNPKQKERGTMKRMMTLLAVGGLVLALAGEANAWLISVDMNYNAASIATVYETVSTYHLVGDLKNAGQNSTDDQIGVWDNGTASSNWWNYITVNSRTWEATGLRDADKNVTGVSLYHVNPATGWLGTVGGTDDLLTDGSDEGGAGALTTTISGLDSGSPYNVIVYHWVNKDVPETVTVNSQAASDYTGDPANPGYADAYDGITDSSFWYFENVAANGSGELVISTDGDGWNNIAGFQVRTPPPPPQGTVVIFR